MHNLKKYNKITKTSNRYQKTIIDCNKHAMFDNSIIHALFLDFEQFKYEESQFDFL